MKLYNQTISRKTKRQPAQYVGYYTTKDAAEVLGVDVATLRYRRDGADAAAYWDMLGLTMTDQAFKHLAESHEIFDGHDYYEKKAFNKFVNLYLKRPNVQRARKRFATFPQGRNKLFSKKIESPAELRKVQQHLVTLFMTDGCITCEIYGE
jgi:hypothetical protein